MSNGFYRAFEDRYRGSRELIKSRLRVYLPFVEPLKAIHPRCTAIDLGCGRGEWLELMAEAGIEAHGVDIDDGMLAECRSRGLPAERGEAVAFLRALPDESAAVVSAFHVAEHIPFADLQDLVQQALRVLQPAGLLILETPNPENLVVGTSSFFLDPTHERPLPPALLSFLPEHYGFARTKVLRLQEPVGLAQSATVNLKNVLADVSPDFAVVAQKGGAGPQQMALFDAAFEREYGVELPTLAARYEEGIAGRLAEILSKIDRSAEFEARAREADQALAAAQQRLAVRDVEVAGLNARLAELATQGQQQLAARDAEITNLNARIAELASQGQQQLAERDAEIARLNESVAALLSSLSWRLTAPLRAVGRFVQRLSVEGAALGRGAGAATVKWAGDRAQRSPALQRLALRLLHRFPALEWRLRRIYRERATAEQAQPAPWSGAGSTDETASAAATEAGAEIVPRGDGGGVNAHQRGPLEANFRAYRSGP